MAEKNFYLTKEGLNRIKREYNDLRKIKLLKTKNDVPKIWQSEDLNPEYLAFLEDLSLLEARIVDLEHILKNTVLIKTPSPERRDTIDIGAQVVVEVGGQLDEFQIVGTLEANPATGKISNESPVGRALLGRSIGEEVVISSPLKTIYKIKKIKY